MLAAVTLFVLPCANADTSTKAGNESPRDLFKRVESLDRALFDAFNRCELGKLENFFVPELEFYHDKAGVTWSRKKFLDDVKKNVCGKFRRELVTGSLEVFPLGNYGAVYSGTHRFCKTGASQCEGSGRFMHIWQNKEGDWKITRVISYDHKALQ
jgi:hypothetical protein